MRDIIEGVKYAEDTWILTNIEECLELYPFKVGDKVHIPEYESEVSICKAKWNPHPFCRHVEYLVQRNDEEVWYSAQELKECNADFLISILVDKEYSERLDNIILDSLYKEGLKKSEENNEERKYAELRMPLDDDDKLSTEVTIDGNKIFPPNNYLIGKVTKVDNGMLVEFVKKQLKYPKTYKECCEVLDIESEWHLTFELNNFASCDLCINKEFEYICKLEAFRKLLICRDAYWMIAGEEMELKEPWKPDWTDNYQKKWTINFYQGEINLTKGPNVHFVLAFPTEEMRDMFYENFKDLIESCKELL
jgi:hypothetical protein